MACSVLGWVLGGWGGDKSVLANAFLQLRWHMACSVQRHGDLALGSCTAASTAILSRRSYTVHIFIFTLILLIIILHLLFHDIIRLHFLFCNIITLDMIFCKIIVTVLADSYLLTRLVDDSALLVAESDPF